MHLNPWQAPVAVVFGLLAGWWTVRVASILPAVLGHALNNVGSLVTVPLLRWDTIPGYADGATTLWQPLWFNGLGLLLFVAGIASTHLILARAPHRRLQPLPPPTARAGATAIDRRQWVGPQELRDHDS